MDPEDDNRASLAKAISATLATVFFLSVTGLMVILLVVGEENVSDSIVDTLYLLTPVTFVCWKGWGWLSSIKIERIDDDDKS